MTELEDLRQHLLTAIDACAGIDALDSVRVDALGKQGRVTQLLKTLGGMSPDERQVQGPLINGLREDVAAAIAARKAMLEASALDARLADERLDMTLPVDAPPAGTIHPVSQVMDELAEIFADLGFAVATGPEIEDDWHNFTALNIPETHPARAMHDTFYMSPSPPLAGERVGERGMIATMPTLPLSPALSPEGEREKMVLRTHTSPVQIRAMQAAGGNTPIRIIAPGRTYRSDSDATHTPMFHQVEGLVIDKGITLGHLKWTLETFLKAFFERDDVVLRLRPSYFPFTEPSAEVDVGYTLVKGKRVIGGSEGWMEVLGSGMVHRKVLEAGGYDPDEWQGFAFGCGIDRLAMLKYGMDDLRAFFDGDNRWLKHYGFSAFDMPTLSGGVGGMKFTLGWLKEHLDTDAALDTIVEALTRVGLEVEGVHNPGDTLAPFIVARVLSAAPHPQADKLQVLSVDAGPNFNDGAPLQVVCGAPNARAGLVGVFGVPGATVPANGMVLKVASIRGVESNGMMCSTRELELGDEHDGIIELPADAPVGVSYADYAGLTDPVIDVSITPNRQDCMGVRGIARDLAAAGLGTLRSLEIVYRSGVAPVPGDGAGPDVRTDDSEGCPAFFAQGVSGVTNVASPEWMMKKLRAIGQKPISALVDITNFISVDLGRPLHVYDKAKLSGGLVARKANAGESVLALNGKTYTLDETMTVIADDARVHDIGGIMGGEDSGVSDTTTDVIIECAYFDPDHIARTGQKLMLTSDARQRFERGVDPAFLDDGLAIATRLVLDLCGGTASEVTRAGEPPLAERVIHYDPHLCRDLGGLAVSPERQARILLSLGFSIGAIHDADAFSDALFATIEGRWPVRVPSWRRDVEGPPDLVEEVIRIEGIDKVPSTPLSRLPGVAVPTATPEQKLERRMRRAAAARGLDEAVTWSFVSEGEAAPFGGGAWTLANPISEDLKVMRPSLLPGLLSAAARNVKRGAGSIRLFEIGRRYLPDDERATLGVILAGDRRVRGWREGKAANFDAYDAKAEALALLAVAGAPVENLQVMGEAGDAWHPGQSGTLRLGPKTVLAAFGVIHPSVTKAFDLDGAVAGVEVYLDAIPAKRASGFMRPAYTPPALQAVKRDFAFLVPAGLSADALVRAVRGADKAAIVGARVFDVFAKDGETSMAVEIVLQPGDKAFVDADLKAIADKVIAAAAKLGGGIAWLNFPAPFVSSEVEKR